MIELRERVRFAREAREPVGIVGKRCRQDFDGDVAIQSSDRGQRTPHPCRQRLAALRPHMGRLSYRARGSSEGVARLYGAIADCAADGRGSAALGGLPTRVR